MSRRLKILLLGAPLLWEAGLIGLALEEAGGPWYASGGILLVLPRAYVALAPLIAALAAGALFIDADGIRRIGRVTIFALLALLVADHVVVPTTTAASTQLIEKLPDRWPDLLGDEPSFYELSGTAPTLTNIVFDGAAFAQGSDHPPEWWLARGIERVAGYLFIPIMIGMMCGAWALVLRAVPVPDRGDRHRLTKLASWVVVPLSFFILAEWTSEIREDAQFGGSPWMTCIPLIPAGILAWAGWRSAKRYASSVPATTAKSPPSRPSTFTS